MSKNKQAAAPELTREQLMATIEQLRQQLEEAESGAGFTPSDQTDAVDVDHVAQQAAEGQRQRQVNASKYSGSAEVHGLSHEHDLDEDLDVEDRDTEVIEWQNPSNLEAPAPRPGMVQRWIRASFRAGEDPGNIMRARREGWRPRPVSTVDRSYAPATITHKTFGEVIAVEGLILCEMPIKVARQRYKFYQSLLAAQNEAITRDIHRDERPGMPIIADRRATVTRGRKPETIGD